MWSFVLLLVVVPIALTLDGASSIKDVQPFGALIDIWRRRRTIVRYLLPRLIPLALVVLWGFRPSGIPTLDGWGPLLGVLVWAWMFWRALRSR